ncbi:MAG TPA: hypothetical protein VFS44_15330 [Gemmatimonadaceae bacterium]|nr:hypothetical protein [Gemmatimonadaceae bacterium]
MSATGRGTHRARGLGDVSSQEKKSITHGDFWIPEPERELYKSVLRALNEAGVPYVIAGAYAIYEHTGIYRETKDLDLFVEPAHVISAMRVLRGIGLTTRLEQAHWLAKAIDGRRFVDVIFGMGNGLALIDADWYRHSRPAILAATPIRVAPPEELIWHRLFISERHRQDRADIVHLIASVGPLMDWRRLVEKTGENWPLLLAQLQMFFYVYPEYPGAVPGWVMSELLERAVVELHRERSGERVTRGTLVSRFSFTIDVNEWGFRDLRAESVSAMERQPVIRELATSDVWDERSRSVEEYHARVA